MQCLACRAVYSNGLDICPRCKTPASTPVAGHEAEPAQTSREDETAPARAQGDTSPQETAPPVSTLIEFPGTARPQWRRELSERVREIQERRAREAAREAAEAALKRERQAAAESLVPQLGLVRPPDAPAINPIVAAALKRIERAHQSPPPMTRSRPSMSGAAVAVARVTQEEEQQEQQYHTSARPAPVVRPASQPLMPASVPLPGSEKTLRVKSTEVQREHNLAVVPAQAPPKTVPAAIRPQSQRVGVEAVDDEVLAGLETQTPDAARLEELYDDRAPVISRLAAGLIDLLVVAFASSPFAAIIELTNGNWTDVRISASMGGILVVVMFLYLVASTAMTGRTWGMSLVSLRAVDADTGLLPTTKQSTWRALVYMVSLVALGLGILYALFDAEGRTVHDHLSGTAVVRE